MFAIVEIAGKQVKVESSNEYFVDKLEGAAGDSVSFDNVLLTSDEGNTTVGAPSVGGTKSKRNNCRACKR